MGTLDRIMDRPDHECVLAVSHGAACAQVLRALDYDYRSSGKRLGNCCIGEYDYSPSLGLSGSDIYNPND